MNHEFCGREIKLLDEAGGVDEAYPNYYPNH
jgi:hypothetical protein